MLNIKYGIQMMPSETLNLLIFDKKMSRLNKPMFKNQNKNGKKFCFDLGNLRNRNNFVILLTLVVFCLNIVPSST